MANVVLDQLTKLYGRFLAVDGLTLEIADGEFLVLVGPSGCGKSTALRMIAGLEEISDGAVWIGDEFVNDVHPKDRNIAMVFQSYALYPHMTVYDNIAFALQISRLPRAETDRRVRDAARILELEPFLKRRPGQLSGGQRQRVAMGRAIVRSPQVFLMDEPLSNLDAKLRVQMRAEIAQLQRRLGTTTVYVTHDQVEAMTMGHRVALLKDGVLQQVDTPSGIYDRPVNTFVAAFIGAPTMNLYSATLDGLSADGATLHLGSQPIRVPPMVLAERPGLGRYAGGRVIAGIRPEALEDAAVRKDVPPDSRLRSTVDLIEALGSDLLVHFGLDADPVEVRSSDSLEGIATDHDDRHRSRCIARLTPRSRVEAGGPVEVVVDSERLQFFDCDSGLAIWR